MGLFWDAFKILVCRGDEIPEPTSPTGIRKFIEMGWNDHGRRVGNPAYIEWADNRIAELEAELQKKTEIANENQKGCSNESDSTNRGKMG